LACRLESIAITGKHVEQKYEAISYVWGIPPFSGQILCNDRVVKISSNLEQALKHLRLADTERVLWADALCINQHDDDEKSEQVKRMTLIYSVNRE